MGDASHCNGDHASASPSQDAVKEAEVAKNEANADFKGASVIACRAAVSFVPNHHIFFIGDSPTTSSADEYLLPCRQTLPSCSRRVHACHRAEPQQCCVPRQSVGSPPAFRSIRQRLVRCYPGNRVGPQVCEGE